MKYIIPVILNHIVGLPTYCSKGGHPNLEYDNSHGVLPAYNEAVPGCSKHRIITDLALTTYS